MVPNGFQHVLGLGNFPSDWLITSADEITEKITKGTTPPKSEIVDDKKIPFLRVNNLGFNGSLKSNSEMLFVTEDAHNGFLSRSIAYPNDILMNIVGPPLGKIAMLGSEYPEYNMNQAVLIYRCKEQLIDNGYFLSFLGSELAQQWLQSRSKKTSGQQNLTIQLCKELPTPVPPLPEQRKIAKTLSTWDKAIATTEKLIETSKQQKKALMQQLLTGKKRLVNPETGKVFEGKWEEVKVSQFGSVVSGGTPSTENSSYWNGNVHWVTPTDITKLSTRTINKTARTITEQGLKNSSAKLVPAGSLLVCTRATIGEIAISQHEMCTNQGFKNLIPNKRTNIDFLYYLMCFEKHKLLSKASGSTFLELSKKDFEHIRFVVPKVKEQQKIASVLIVADKEVEVLEAKLAHFKQEKKALMQQLLTGKRRVKVDEMEAA
ncbi:restriction endonuclease subunit S [Vibrio parahaemolyticus]|uniref:restriction endonuclease subunit S n=1 Tax=Vibrio parahaemolyticus TaxID=670 RepID=UPI001E4F292B|nr:restriction endonuclease subunit S [Vibrio parahaemolyticus]